jgi:hypothetical protein
MQGRAGGVSRVWAAIVFMTMLAVSGCLSLPPNTAGNEKPDALAACCENAERQPQWLVDLVKPIAPGLGTAIGHVTWRNGYILSREDAHQAIRAEIRPLDIVVVSSKGRMSGHTIPGLFGHALIYIGTEAELRAARHLGPPGYPAVSERHHGLGRFFLKPIIKASICPRSIVR